MRATRNLVSRWLNLLLMLLSNSVQAAVGLHWENPLCDERERIAALGGKVTVDSRPTEGTVLDINIPLAFS